MSSNVSFVLNYLKFLFDKSLKVLIILGLLVAFQPLNIISIDVDSTVQQVSDNFLCRQCGTDLADVNYIFDIKSPLAILVGKKNISRVSAVLQILENPLKIRFNVITVKKSACVGVGKWVNDHSWFPGFAWKLCLCRHCGHHIGWVFEPFATAESSQVKASEAGFYVLIYENITIKQDTMSEDLNTNQDQQEFLKRLEEQFKDRFTENDECYRKFCAKGVEPPPLVEYWRGPNRPHQRNRYQNHRQNYRDAPRARPVSNMETIFQRGYNNHSSGYGEERRGYNDNYRRRRDDYY